MDTGIHLAEVAGLAVVIGVVESSMARLRLNRVPYLLISAVILSVFSLIIIFVRGN